MCPIHTHTSPCQSIELVATGTVTSASKALLVAHSELRTKEDGKLVASGSGTFMKHPVVRIADMEF